MRKGKRAGRRGSKGNGNRKADNSETSGEEVELLELSVSWLIPMSEDVRNPQ